MTVLDEIIEKLQGSTQVLPGLIAQHQKLTPNQTIPDQIEELQEVWEYLTERLQALRADLQDDAEVPLRSLLSEVVITETWLQQNTSNLQGFWPPQQISDSIEAQRERSLRAYTTRISLALLQTHDEQGTITGNLESILEKPATEDINLVALGQLANSLPIPALTKATERIKAEQEQLDHGVADFTACTAATAMAQIVQTLQAAAEVRLAADSRARNLAQLVVGDFSTVNNTATSLYRRASASTLESPLDPHASPSRSSPRNRPPLPSPGTARTPNDEMYFNFRPSFVPNISESTFESDGGGTLQSQSSGSTRLPYLDTSTIHQRVSTPVPVPEHRHEPVASTSASFNTSNGRNGSPSLGERLNLSSSIIAFNARDALTNEPLVDPVLGSDGLIHDRWSLLDTDFELARSIRILGDVIQLREAIHAAHPARKDEFGQKRASYRRRAIELCTSTDPKVIKDCISRLSDVLGWKPEDVEVMTRRGVLYYRLRQLSLAKMDLDQAVKASQTASLLNLPNLDSLRYRCLVLSEIRDTDNCLLDIDEVVRQTKDDPLALSLRATIRAGKGDFDNAMADLNVVRSSLEKGGGSQSMLADENRDLDLLAKGWAHSSLGDIESAVNDFEMAQSLRIFDAYSVSCLGISLVHSGVTITAKGDEIEGREKVRQGLAELTSAVVVVSRNSTGEELSLPSPNGTVDEELVAMTLPSHAYDPFFLRGMANFALSKYEEALEDFGVAQRVRPKIVKDTGEFHCVLAILQAETGQYDVATRSFDYAMALKPEERDNYLAKRAQYGL